jgi:hypothetical protein
MDEMSEKNKYFHFLTLEDEATALSRNFWKD